MIQLTDNRFGNQAEKFCFENSPAEKNVRRICHGKTEKGVWDLVSKCANQKICDLQTESQGNLIVFTQKNWDDSFYEIRGCIPENPPDSFCLETGNMMGILNLRGHGTSVKIQIQSRFDQDGKQYFLNYLLGKVFEVNFSDLVSAQDEIMWDMMLAFAFLWRFRKAGEIGLYKQYHKNEYNDLNFRGKLDLDRHLKRNYPLCGKIACSKREITFDNPLNHLLRFALAKIEKKWPSMLDSSRDVRQLLTELKQATPTWTGGSPTRILNHKDTLYPVRQPYFAEHYEPLRKIARMLLSDEGANVYDQPEQNSDLEISGVIFDGAWLWEEYIATLLPEYLHASYDEKRHPIPIFEGESNSFYPDFRWNDSSGNCKVVLDTKYKKDSKTGNREDIHQVLCYMFLTGADRGGLVYPPKDPQDGNTNSQTKSDDENVGVKQLTIDQKTVETEKFWRNFSFEPVSACKGLDDFCNTMKASEEKFREFALENAESDSAITG